MVTPSKSNHAHINPLTGKAINAKPVKEGKAMDKLADQINAPHVVAVISETVVETADENICYVVRRGVYCFTSFKKARRFKTIVNDANTSETPAAYLFTAFNEKEQDND